MEEGPTYRKEFIGVGKVEKAIVDLARGLADARLSPSDLTNPVSFQLAFSRLYKALIESMEGGPKEEYVSEVRFKDDLGNDVVLAIDLGKEVPPFAKKNIRARIIVELYEEAEQ